MMISARVIYCVKTHAVRPGCQVSVFEESLLEVSDITTPIVHATSGKQARLQGFRILSRPRAMAHAGLGEASSS
jgi:hypothetical protein